MAVPASNKIFINGEDINFGGITAGRLGEIEETAFRVYAPDRRHDIYLFIDEVQNFLNWARWLRTLSDSGRYKLVVTGSTSELSTDRLALGDEGEGAQHAGAPVFVRGVPEGEGEDILPLYAGGEGRRNGGARRRIPGIQRVPRGRAERRGPPEAEGPPGALRKRDAVRHSGEAGGEKGVFREGVHGRRPRLRLQAGLGPFHLPLARVGGDHGGKADGHQLSRRRRERLPSLSSVPTPIQRSRRRGG